MPRAKKRSTDAEKVAARTHIAVNLAAAERSLRKAMEFGDEHLNREMRNRIANCHNLTRAALAGIIEWPATAAEREAARFKKAAQRARRS